MYCEKCHNGHKPQRGNFFLTFGTSSQDYYIDKAVLTLEQVTYRKFIFGFTPHLIEKTGIDGDFVLYEATCCISGCGISIKREGEEYLWKIENSKNGKMHVSDWNAMILNPDIGYRI